MRNGSEYFGDRLPAFVRSYYEQLKGDYESAGIAVEAPLNEQPTWDDVYRMEIALLRAREENDLRRCAWIVRMRFHNVAGDATFQLYLNSLPPDPSNAPRELLLADLVNLLRRTYYLIVLSPASEAIRQQLLLGAIIIGVVVLGIILLIVGLAHRVPQSGIFGLSLLAGAVGGTMSLIQRVQSLPEADPLLFRLSGSTTIAQTLSIPPLAGAIFAGVLFMIFAGHLLTGTIFPVIYNAVPAIGEHGISFVTFFDSTIATSSKDFALMLVWAFVAGFAERFVPDTINRLTAQRTAETKSKPT